MGELVEYVVNPPVEFEHKYAVGNDLACFFF